MAKIVCRRKIVMDKEQGELLTDLASTPRLGILRWGQRTFDWWKNNPNKVYNRDNHAYADALIVEGNVYKMATMLEQDKEKIERWLKRFEEYKERYPKG